MVADQLRVAGAGGGSPWDTLVVPQGRHLPVGARQGVALALVTQRHRQSPADRRASAEAAAADIADRGRFAVRAPDRHIPAPDCRHRLRPAGAGLARPARDGLRARREAWGFGAHVALVRLDRDTGQPALEKLVLVDDCGVILNPRIVAGQVHGGVAQGLGEAFYEQMRYGDDGQPLTASLLDYAVPRASQMPPLILGETVTPNPFHPLGVKGVGEAGCNGAPPAIANAVMDALAPLGIDHLDMPYTAPKLWEAIQAARGPRTQ